MAGIVFDRSWYSHGSFTTARAAASVSLVPTSFKFKLCVLLKKTNEKAGKLQVWLLKKANGKREAAGTVEEAG